MVRTVAIAAQTPTAKRQSPSWARFALEAELIIVAPVASSAPVLSRTRSRLRETTAGESSVPRR
jgi:hypothetical protein